MEGVPWVGGSRYLEAAGVDDGPRRLAELLQDIPWGKR